MRVVKWRIEILFKFALCLDNVKLKRAQKAVFVKDLVFSEAVARVKRSAFVFKNYGIIYSEKTFPKPASRLWERKYHPILLRKRNTATKNSVSKGPMQEKTMHLTAPLFSLFAMP